LAPILSLLRSRWLDLGAEQSSEIDCELDSKISEIIVTDSVTPGL
jgi:hypothetical protein